MRRAILMAALATFGSGWLSACGNQQSAPPPARASEDSFVVSGDYEMHFNAFRTDQITADVARLYGIQRSKNQVLLNVTVLHKEADHAPRKPVEANVTVDAYNLNGQLKNLELRRVTEGEAVYYIGATSISGTEILVFDIEAKPVDEAVQLTAKLKREFYSD